MRNISVYYFLFFFYQVLSIFNLIVSRFSGGWLQSSSINYFWQNSSKYLKRVFRMKFLIKCFNDYMCPWRHFQKNLELIKLNLNFCRTGLQMCDQCNEYTENRYKGAGKLHIPKFCTK